MKRIKSVNGFTIFQLSQKEQEDRNITSEFVLFDKEEMKQPSFTRNIEWEADTIEEIEGWANDYVHC
jgi:hypothetical protein